MAKKLTSRASDYSKWYNDLVAQAELADHSPVRGCMVIRPNGYAIWERMQADLDGRIKATGHENLYFPLFVPESFLKKEAEHVEGFAPECAVVTHGGGKELEEPLVVRPTSETVIWHMYKSWISSYRDLPLLYNQWANVVRWEMRTRLFLRTTEFLWQEGHTAHAGEEEAREEALNMLEMYRTFCEETLAIPVICGRKTENEKFAGAVDTYSIEGLMQDGKALQMGTSHYLGENFAKAFDVTYQSESGELKHVHATSWGVTTRMIGALIMSHSDDKGLVVPPALARFKAVIVPIWKSEEEKQAIRDFVANLLEQLPPEWQVQFDDREEYKPGYKYNEWELKGIPLRLEIGPRDLREEQVMMARRDTGEKRAVPMGQLHQAMEEWLAAIQTDLLTQSRTRIAENSHQIDDYEAFKAQLEGAGGFLYCHWCGDGVCEKAISDETKATIRNIPFDSPEESGSCIRCGNPSHQRVIFSKAY
jgi:prolyl-tRNA synthetase